MAADETPTEPAGDTPPQPSAPTEDGWRQDKQGRFFTAAKGRSGIVYRQANETVAEALARDAKGPADRKPKGKAKAPKPPAPTQQDLKQLEHALADGLKAPAMAMAAIGDEWAAEHFMTQGPLLARNLVAAAEHNPWLRAKLEAMVVGPDVFLKLMSTMALGGAIFAYAAPPLIYFLNPPFVPEKAREMLAIPKREKEAAPHAPTPPPPAAPTPQSAGPPAA